MRRRSIGNLLVLLNGLLFLAVGAAVGADLWLGRERTLQHAFRDSANLTSVLAEHTLQTVTAIDQMLSGLAETIPAAGASGGAPEERVYQLLADRQSTAVGVHNILVLDREGTLRFSAQTAQPPPTTEFAERPFFIHHRDTPDSGLFIGLPMRGREEDSGGAPVLYMSRALRGQDGSLIGVAAAVVSLARFQAMYQTLDVGPNAVVGLFRTNGSLLARRPPAPQIEGDAFRESHFVRNVLPQGPVGAFRHKFSIDGVPRLTAYETIKAADLVVFVALAEVDILARWRQGAIVGLATTALLLGLLAAASVLLKRTADRREREQRKKEEQLALLSGASADIVGLQDISTIASRTVSCARSIARAERATLVLAPDRITTYSDAPQQPTVANAKSSGTRAEPSFEAPLLTADGRGIGVLQVQGRTEPSDGSFSAEDEAHILQLARIAAVAIGNIELVSAAHAAAGEARDQRAAAERALAEADAARVQMEHILSSISDAFYTLDENWRFTYVNTNTTRILGIPPDQMIGRNIWEQFPDLLRTDAFEGYYRARETGEPQDLRFFYTPLSSWFDVRAVPTDKGLTVYFRDVTERLEMEERLHQSQKMEAVGQLTGGVAHDFNNILTVILGNAELLMDELADQPDLRSLAEGAVDAADRGAELTSRLLAFSRRQPLAPAETDIGALIAGMETLLRRSLGEQIDVRIVLAPDLWSAFADRSQVENAVLNLAINARDAMPEGGRLTIEMSNAELSEDDDPTNAVQPGDYVKIAVTDTGTGMPPDVVARAFEPFFTTKAVGKGSGLGLSMIYGFAKQSGGNVRIDSTVGRGTTVTLYLPRARTESATMDAAGPEDAMPRGTERILLVEDDPTVRRYAQSILEQLGYQCTAAANGPEALTLLDAGDYDLLLTDVILPEGMNGRQIADEAKRRRPGLRVLFMSGYTENAIIHEGRLEPGVLLLNKPFRRAEIARKVRMALAETKSD